MGTSENSARRERPAGVLALCLVFCFWAVTFFALYGLQLVEVQAGRDQSATVLEVGLAIFVLVIWCVGMARLFWMKADAWLWLTAGLVLGLPLTCLSIMHHRVLGHDITWPVLASVARYIIATGIIYYAYRLFSDDAEKA